MDYCSAGLASALPSPASIDVQTRMDLLGSELADGLASTSADGRLSEDLAAQS
jgi:hypothetical protein